jgi:hypothetical protein
MVTTQSGAWGQEAAMTLRPHRRNVVVWSQSAGSADRYGNQRVTRSRRFRRRARIGVLLTVVGLLHLARGVRARWRPVLAGVMLTVTGLTLRGGDGGVILLPGVMLLLSAPIMPGTHAADQRRTRLERELAGYSTTAQLHDLEATLDQYPDDVTRELRDILAGQTTAAPVPGRGPALRSRV